MVAKPATSTAKGYGIVSQGSSTSAFLGTNQSFFLGGKQSTTIGAVNSTTLGFSTSMSVGPSVSLSYSPPWDSKLGDAGTRQLANWFAKYDFTNNKSFAFSIAEEGSSAYTTKSKFICRDLFQAMSGFQPIAAGIYTTYTQTISNMCLLVLAVEIALAVETLMEVLYIPEQPSTLEMDLAKGIPATTNALSSLALAYMGISAAAQRESVFKAAISPQSVFTLDKERIFLGALGSVAKQQQGASLSLENGRATLGSRTISPASVAKEKPYKEKFIDFNEPATAYVAVDTYQIQQLASNKISLTAGLFVDPIKEAIDKQNAAAQLAFDAVFFDLGSIYLGEDRTLELAQQAYDASFTAGQAAVDSVKAALVAENSYFMTNPSILLKALGGPGSMVQVEAPIFNVKAPLITLQTNPETTETCSVSLDPLSGISLQQSPLCTFNLTETNEIVMRAGATTSVELTPTFASINCVTNAIAMSETGVNVDAPKITLTAPLVQIGAGLKVLG